MRLWDGAAGVPIATLEGHSRRVNSRPTALDLLRDQSTAQ